MQQKVPNMRWSYLREIDLNAEKFWLERIHLWRNLYETLPFYNVLIDRVNIKKIGERRQTIIMKEGDVDRFIKTFFKPEEFHERMVPGRHFDYSKNREEFPYYKAFYSFSDPKLCKLDIKLCMLSTLNETIEDEYTHTQFPPMNYLVLIHDTIRLPIYIPTPTVVNATLIETKWGDEVGIEVKFEDRINPNTVFSYFDSDCSYQDYYYIVNKVNAKRLSHDGLVQLLDINTFLTDEIWPFVDEPPKQQKLVLLNGLSKEDMFDFVIGGLFALFEKPLKKEVEEFLKSHGL